MYLLFSMPENTALKKGGKLMLKSVFLAIKTKKPAWYWRGECLLNLFLFFNYLFLAATSTPAVPKTTVNN